MPELDLDSVPLEPERYDCVAILTAHSGIDYDELVRRAPLLVDFRNATGDTGRQAANVWKL